MTLPEFRKLIDQEGQAGFDAGKILVVPIAKKLGADLLTPVSAFLAAREPHAYAFLLESVEGGEHLGRYSFIGKNPFLVLESSDRESTLTHYGGDGQPAERESLGTPFFEAMQSVLDRYHEVAAPGLPRLRGGAVGYTSYDAVRLLERISENGEETPRPDHPDAVWGFYSSILAFDHVKHQIVLISNALVRDREDVERSYEAAVANLEQMSATILEARFDKPERFSLREGGLKSNMAQGEFERAVVEAKHHIFEGDALQIVLSQRFETEFEGDRFNLYRALRQVNPSPYLYYLDFDSFGLIGSSPEVLVRVDGDRVELLPIAGTRPRGKE